MKRQKVHKDKGLGKLLLMLKENFFLLKTMLKNNLLFSTGFPEGTDTSVWITEITENSEISRTLLQRPSSSVDKNRTHILCYSTKRGAVL